MGRRGCWVPIGFLFICTMWGCSELPAEPAPSPLVSPLFTPSIEDTKCIAALTHELNNRGLYCIEDATCDQVHFDRALLSLFENKEAASASFRRVIQDNPASALAASSRLWLQLIEREEVKPTFAKDPHPTVVPLMAQVVREWMTLKLTEHTKRKPASAVGAQNRPGESSDVVQTLQKQVLERDRRIAILQSQMEDLKLIDQDSEKRKRPIKLPSTLP